MAWLCLSHPDRGGPPLTLPLCNLVLQFSPTILVLPGSILQNLKSAVVVTFWNSPTISAILSAFFVMGVCCSWIMCSWGLPLLLLLLLLLVWHSAAVIGTAGGDFAAALCVYFNVVHSNSLQLSSIFIHFIYFYPFHSAVVRDGVKKERPS